MNHAIRKIGIGIIILFALLFIPYLSAEATSGACSWHGGVNCSAGADWDGSAICNDGWRDSSVSYYSVKKCMGYDYYDDYNYPSYPTIPDCPLNSYYDSLSDSCKCYSSYVVSGGKCISADQYCRDLFGFNARHNILADKCECSYGYILSGSRCISGDSYCHNKYGYHSSYNSLSESCKCDYGYVFDSLDQCVSRDEYCQDLYDYNAEYNILSDSCVCKSGYVVDSSKTRCIDGDLYCQNEYGYHSSYDSLSKTCECDYGYEFRNNECIKQEDEEEEDFYIYKPISPFTFNKTPEPESDTTSALEPQTSSDDTPKSQNKIISGPREEIKCDPGYALSFNKKNCVEIPESAHAVDSPTDLWLCDDGYKEVNNICVLVEDQEEIIDQDEEQGIEEQPRERKKVLKFLANALTTVGDLFKNFFKLLIKRINL